MRFAYLGLVVIFLYAVLWTPPSSVALGTNIIEDYRDLLQKGLTIHEIDQELARLSVREVRLAEEILIAEQEIEQKNEFVKHTKERAGQVLKSYYIGDRDSLLMLILTVDSLTEALNALEFIGIIFQNDQASLKRYLEAYQNLKALHSELITMQESLQMIKEEFVAQRAALVAMQEDLDAELAAYEEAESLERMIADLTRDWETKGLPVFRSYFKALADAMNNLAEIQQQHNNVLSLSGTSIRFQITDEQLNEFLAHQNDMLNNLSFTFKEDAIEATGKHEQIDMGIKGHYQLIQEPTNHIQFTIYEMLYNGFYLPESTIKSLEEQFDLGFYPDKINFLGLRLEATEVQTDLGQLKVTLRFRGSS